MKELVCSSFIASMKTIRHKGGSMLRINQQELSRRGATSAGMSDDFLSENKSKIYPVCGGQHDPDYPKYLEEGY
jgi:hypothetical protein